MTRVAVFLLIFFTSVFLIEVWVFSNIAENFNKSVVNDSACFDGSLNGICASEKPYFCQNGVLEEKADICGCPKNLIIANEKCISQFQTEPRNITLNYTLRGEKFEINYTIYKGMVDYLSKLPIYITSNGNNISRTDFKLRNINQEEQKILLFPLVVEIEKISESDEDAARIAISLAQNIEWGNSNKTSFFRDTEIQYSRYPYEVLYDAQGVCGEKSELLAFLLQEFGYETAIFYNHDENHESVGVKCQMEKSWKNTGYCFIETTGPAIISDSSIIYSGGFSLVSEPQVLPISDGKPFSEDMYEYADAEKITEIRKIFSGDKFFFNPWRFVEFRKLEKKYGLVKSYQAG